jgi:hypothetical protein
MNTLVYDAWFSPQSICQTMTIRVRIISDTPYFLPETSLRPICQSHHNPHSKSYLEIRVGEQMLRFDYCLILGAIYTIEINTLGWICQPNPKTCACEQAWCQRRLVRRQCHHFYVWPPLVKYSFPSCVKLPLHVFLSTLNEYRF